MTTATRRAGVWLADAGLVGGLLALTWWIGARSTDFAGSPKGADALDHAATVRLLMENFPHLLWNPAWFGGMPSVPGLYPPGYALMIAAVVTASGASIQHAMVDCGAAAYLVMVASLYGFVRVIAKSRTAAILAGLLVLAVPAFWAPSLQVGEYPRLTAMAFGYLATFLAALYTIKPSRVRLVAAVLVTGAAFAIHPITGGLGALQVLGVLLFVPYHPRRERVRTAGAAAAAMGGLAAWLYVPSLVGVRTYYILPQARFEPSHRTSFAYLLYPAARTLTAFSPILLPLALLLTGIAAFVVRRLRPGAYGSFGRALGSSAAMMIVVLCVLGYAFAGRLTHASIELVGVYPNDMFSYAAWPLAAASGVLIASLLSLVPWPDRPTWRVRAFAVAFAGAIACLAAMIPVLSDGAYSYEQEAYAVAPLLPGGDGTGQYRLGLTDQTESSWINVFTRTPEVGGPFNQGALDLDYMAWAESVLTNPAPPVAEAKYIAQWNSLRWIEAGPAQRGFYQHNPDAYRYLGPSGAYRNYEVRQPSPVLAATDTPPVLVIGPYDNYNLLLRSLAVTDDGPSRVIPVEGTSYIDDYSLAELERFPVLFLYGFQAHDPATAAGLIDAYVRAGGGVIADVAGDGQLATELVQHGAPLPVTSWEPVELSGAWGYRNSRNPLTRGIDLGQFSPALYAGTQPYLVEAAQRLAPGSEVVLGSGARELAPVTQMPLLSGPRPLLAARTAGNGLVIESGINLPYHDAVFSNATESLLLVRMIQTATARWWASGQPVQAGVVLAADSARVQAGPAGGVLFKQTDTPDWHATVDGHAAATYPAGPGYIYVPLASGDRASATVEFRYQLSTTEWGSIAGSLLTGLLLLGFLCRVRLPGRLRKRLDRATAHLVHRVLPLRKEVQVIRQQLAELMTDPSPGVRRAALRALPLHHLEPYADLLVAHLAEESDDSVLGALKDVVAMHQWEPVSSAASLELRLWAAGMATVSAGESVHP
ncbi:MAG: hypothetical protein JO345_14795 [Streptosporangiaceae bacterium]|nr:hypothetical protein [Streptosporangiaceae bacterium]